MTEKRDVRPDVMAPETYPGRVPFSPLPWKAVVFPAILRPPDGAEADERSLWEEHESLESLRARRKESGTILFNAGYMNDVSLMRGKIFKHKDIRLYEGLLPDETKKLDIFQGVDLATSKTRLGSANAHATIGIERAAEGRIYVLRIFKIHCSFNEFYQITLQEAAEWKPIRIGIETQQYQESMFEELSRTSTWPFVSKKREKDKVARAWSVSPLFENHRVYVRTEDHDFVHDLLSVPEDDKRWDRFDAFEMALRMAQEVSSDPNIRILAA